MHLHHEQDSQESLRPTGSRIDAEVQDQRLRPMVAGRADAMDADAVTGLQRSAGNAAVSQLLDDGGQSPVHSVINSPGRPLEPEVRADMEDRLGADFGDVRVHDDAAADASAAAVNAHAYTVGSDVVFQRDQFNPSSTVGRVTLAHELTHVVQQRSGPVDGTEAPGGIKISDPSDQFERDAAANAERVMSTPESGPGSPLSGRASLQRETEPPEELPDELPQEDQVQGRFIQRDEEDALPEEEDLE